jgi:uncharacterized protein (TIGR03382 family)
VCKGGGQAGFAPRSPSFEEFTVKNLAISLVAAAGLATIANAQQITRMDVQTSINGTDWSGGARQVNPGTVVQFRYAVTYVANGTTATPVGFASLTFQPTISNWTNADTLSAFANAGNNGTGGSVTEASGLFGRISPFAATGAVATDPYRGHIQTVSGTQYLRIARTVITNWVGVGPTTTTAAANNFNGSGGLPAVQLSQSQATGTQPAFNTSISNVVLAKFAFTLSADGASRTLTVGAPTEGMSRIAATGARAASWFESASDSFGNIKADVQVVNATVEVIPAPGALGLLGAGGLVALRRRRR